MSSSASSPLHLTPRDIAILEMVYGYRGCGVEHLQTRFWLDETTPSASYRRIARLVQERYLSAYRLPSLTGRGSGKALLSLGYRGRRVLAERQGISVRALPRLKLASSALFIHHHFAVCDFRVALERATEAIDHADLRTWTTEDRLKATPMKVADRTVSNGGVASPIVLIPDGAFVVAFQGQEERSFLEMDMGTIAPKRLQRKLRGYLLQQASVPFPIFFVVPDKRRAELIVQLTGCEAGEVGADPTRIFVATRHEVRPTTILTAPIWLQCGTTQPVAILPGTAIERVWEESRPGAARTAARGDQLVFASRR